MATSLYFYISIYISLCSYVFIFSLSLALHTKCQFIQLQLCTHFQYYLYPENFLITCLNYLSSYYSEKILWGRGCSSTVIGLSFNRPWCSFLNGIATSTKLFIKNFCFDVHPIFLHLNLLTATPKKVFMQLQRTSHFGPHILKQVHETHESNLPQLLPQFQPLSIQVKSL